jgi:hypothetical protein
MSADDQHIDQMFNDIADAAIAAEAIDLLAKQVGRCQAWCDEEAAAGNNPTLHALINKVMREPNKRRHILVAYCAAMWALMDTPPVKDWDENAR